MYLTLFLLVLISALQPGPASASTLTGLGDLPGGSFHSEATAISADGRVAVGWSKTDSPGGQAFRWDPLGGIEGLGSLAGPLADSSAEDVSAHGEVVVGWSADEAFIWTRTTGMTGLGPVPDGRATATARAVSDDGQVVVGMVSGGNGFIWNPESGPLLLGGLEDLFGVWGISADGLTVVGSVIRSSGGSFTDAASWTEAGGVATLRLDTIAFAASASGSWIVGNAPCWFPCLCLGGECATSHLWEDGIFAATLESTAAFGMSADGGTVVGATTVVRQDGFDRRAFVWTEESGIRLVEEILIEDGVSLDGWILDEATGVSADGRTIVGNGSGPNGPEAWLVRLPEPDGTAAQTLGLLAGAALAGLRMRIGTRQSSPCP